MRVLVTGASGQVGRELLRAKRTDMEVFAFTHADLDISDEDAVRAVVARVEPTLIINAAAYTAVDRAESEPERAHAVNVDGPRNLARAAYARAACRLLQVSTDYVFDGESAAPYRPGDATNPLNVYGRTKLLGEQTVRDILRERCAIVRTSWVYAPGGRNFVHTMLRLMRERGTVRVVADQTGCPTAASSVATALWRLGQLPQLHGIFHWTDAGMVSWHGFACAIAEAAMALGLLATRPQVIAIDTADYPTAALRPKCSALDTLETARQLGLEPCPWLESLYGVLSSLTTQ